MLKTAKVELLLYIFYFTWVSLSDRECATIIKAKSKAPRQPQLASSPYKWAFSVIHLVFTKVSHSLIVIRMTVALQTFWAGHYASESDNNMLSISACTIHAIKFFKYITSVAWWTINTLRTAFHEFLDFSSSLTGRLHSKLEIVFSVWRSATLSICTQVSWVWHGYHLCLVCNFFILPMLHV